MALSSVGTRHIVPSLHLSGLISCHLSIVPPTIDINRHNALKIITTKINKQ